MSNAMNSRTRAVSPLTTEKPTLHYGAGSVPTADQSDNLVDGYGNPFHVPDYTINDIRKAIPQEYFERSALYGFSYVARDLALLAGTFWLFNTWLDVDGVEPATLRWALWSLYGFLSGLFATGLWVLAHECGHQAFSTSRVLNDSVGFALHSLLLVPYFSWKISHGKHHKGTAHMERDMVFLPRTRREHCERFGVPAGELHEVVQDTPLYAAYYIATRLLFGWPTYLLTNDTGHDFHQRQSDGRGKGKRNGLFTGVNHFNPQSPLFESKDAHLVLLSDVGIVMALGLLYYVGHSFGILQLFKWYGIPYLWVNGWLGQQSPLMISCLVLCINCVCSFYHTTPTYRPIAPTLHRGFVDLCEGRGLDNRP